MSSASIVVDVLHRAKACESGVGAGRNGDGLLSTTISSIGIGPRDAKAKSIFRRCAEFGDTESDFGRKCPGALLPHRIVHQRGIEQEAPVRGAHDLGHRGLLPDRPPAKGLRVPLDVIGQFGGLASLEGEGCSRHWVGIHPCAPMGWLGGGTYSCHGSPRGYSQYNAVHHA